ncbi:MAG: hypothetical protein E7014_04040 [Alphaproteobacteria bacterium]|nr:hypothetical protein [Alphaproteobacteria bacterium]
MRNKLNEIGRSMLEMLGVLAVIGVLSVGGIMGYSYSMDKYKANQTVRDITLRVLDLITQVSNGKEPNLDEWETEKTLYDFGEVGLTSDNLVYMHLGKNKKISKRVCRMIFDSRPREILYVDVNEVEVETNPVCREDNMMTFYFDGGNGVCNPRCAEDETCDNGRCYKNQFFPVRSCQTDTDCGECAYCSYLFTCWRKNNGTPCQNGEGACYNAICTTQGCSSNNDCTGNTFCSSPNTSSTAPFPNGAKGRCLPIDLVQIKLDNSKDIYLYYKQLSWWDANSICAALGKKMMTVDDFVVNWDSNLGSYTPKKLLESIISFVPIFDEQWSCIWTQEKNSSHSWCVGYSGSVKSREKNDYTHIGVCW